MRALSRSVTQRAFRASRLPVLAVMAFLCQPGTAGAQVLSAEPEGPEHLVKGSAIVIQFEGGDYSVDIPRVLEAIHKAGHLPTQPYILNTGDDICTVFRREARVPGGCSIELCDLALALNPKTLDACEHVYPTQEIKVPLVNFQPHGFTEDFNPRVTTERDREQSLARWWEQAQVERTELPDGSRRVAYAGYDLVIQLKSDEEVEQLMETLWELVSPNILPEPVFESKSEKKFYALTTPREFWASCSAHVSSAGEAHLGLLVAESPPICTGYCREGECPEVILIDTKVKASSEWRHPSPTPVPVSSPTPVPDCVSRPIDERTEHGTHMAGILVASEDGYGIRGISPEVPLTSWDYSEYSPVALGHWMQERLRDTGIDSGPPVFVFASSWCIGPTSDPTAPCPTGPGDRFAHAIARRIQRTKAYWITAAGEESETISPSSRRGPMNLGDLSNVVVVAACEDCAKDPKLLPGNISDLGHRMVHVAAPGRNIPSTLGDATYAVASGTSQATAFVGGIAAQMLRCHPTYYGSRRERLKTRLQTSSKPFPPRASAERRDAGISTGVLDATAALLDPTKDWIRDRSRAAWKQVRVKGWLPRELPLLESVTVDEARSPRVRDVYRLVRFEVTASQSQFVIYAAPPYDADRERLGEVERFGPGLLNIPNESFVLELCNGTQYRLSELDDVLLSRPLPTARRCGT